MSDAGRKRWWRAVAIGLVGGGGVSGVWLGFSRLATAESPSPMSPMVPAPTDEPGVWLRAPTEPPPFQVPVEHVTPVSAQIPPAAPLLPAAPPFLVLPVAPALPVVPIAPALSPIPAAPAFSAHTLPALPALPAAPAMLPSLPVPTAFIPTPAGVYPVTPGPRTPDLMMPNGGMQPPAIPSISIGELPTLPPTAAVPALPVNPADVKPMTPPAALTETLTPLPALPVVPGLPPVNAALPSPPAIPATPVPSPPAIPTTLIPSPPAMPATPGVSLPTLPLQTLPVVPSPTGLTPPPLPLKSPEPVQPLPLPKPESGLPSVGGPNNLKADTGAGMPVAPLPPVMPVMPPITNPVQPVTPAVPVVGATGEPPIKVVDRPKPPETRFGDSEKFPFPTPVLPKPPTEPTPGDTTVRNLNHAAALAVIGGALLAPTNPTHAVAPTIPITPIVPMLPTMPTVPVAADDKSDAAALKTALEESNKKLATITEQLKVLTEVLNGKKDSDGIPLPLPGLVAQVRDLKDKLASFEQELAKLKTQTVLRPTNPVPNPMQPIADNKAGKGIVRLVNEYPVRISIVVNGISHRIEPTRSLDVDVPVGEFSYQLLESGAAATKSVIKEKETVTLRIK